MAAPYDRRRASRGADGDPRARPSAALASAIVCSPKWKIDAASTASAPPSTMPVDEVLERADAAAGDDRHADGVDDGPGELEVEALPGAVAVHRREQDLAGAARRRRRPPTRRRRCPVGVRPPWRYTSNPPSAGAWRRSRTRRTGRRTRWRSRRSARAAATAAVLTLTLSAPARSIRRASSTRADAAADGERDEHLLGRAVDDVDHRVAAVARRRDVEEHQLVGALGVVAGGQLDRVAGVAQVDEVGALDDPAVGDVEARDRRGRRSRAAPPTASATREAALVQRPAGDDRRAGRRSRRGRATSSSVPTPPLAMTGTSVAATAAASPSTSGPPSRPSRSMSVMTNAAAAGKRPSASASVHAAGLGPAVHGELAAAVVEPDGDGHDGGDLVDELGVGARPPSPSRRGRRRRRRAPRRRRPSARRRRSARRPGRRRRRRSPRRPAG